MKRLLLLALLCAVCALAFAPAAAAQVYPVQDPAAYQYAQPQHNGGQPGPTTLTATGVLVGPVEDGDQDPTLEFELTDEATGITYRLISGFVDLQAFAGQRVTVVGTRVPGIDPFAFNVTQITPAGATVGTQPLPTTGGPSLVPLVGATLLLGLGVAGLAMRKRIP